MNSLRIVAVSTAMSLFTLAPGANARDFADIYTDCGLGAMIAPKNSAVAAVTNVTWDLGTTAISSNATTPESCKGGQDRTAALIHDTYPSLEQDLARGRGEHLDALLAMADCGAEQRPALLAALREGFGAEIEQPGYGDWSRYQKAEGLFNLFNNVLARKPDRYSCTVG